MDTEPVPQKLRGDDSVSQGEWIAIQFHQDVVLKGRSIISLLRFLSHVQKSPNVEDIYYPRIFLASERESSLAWIGPVIPVACIDFSIRAKSSFP